MKEDLMQTQSGGEGETNQATPVTQETPEQFDVPIKPVTAQQNIDSFVKTSPDNTDISVPENIASTPIPEQTPVKESVSTPDVTEQASIENLEPSKSFIDFSGNEPTINSDSVQPDNTIFLQPEEEPSNFDFDFTFDSNEEPYSSDAIQPELTKDDLQENKQEDEIDYSDFSLSSHDSDSKQESVEPFDFSDPYKEVRDNTINNATGNVQDTPYSDVAVPKYKETSDNLSKSYINGYASLIGMDKLSADVLYESNVGSGSDVLNDVSDLTYSKSLNDSYLSKLDIGIKNNDLSMLKDDKFIDYYASEIKGELMGDVSKYKDSFSKFDVNKAKELQKVLQHKSNTIDSEINSYSKSNASGAVSVKDEYKSDMKSKGKGLKSSLKSKYGKDYGDLVDWMFDKKQYTYIIDNSIDGKGEKFNPGNVLAYKLTQFPNLTESEKGDVYRLAGRIYQERLDDYSNVTGKGDYLSYSGFNLEKKQLEKQDYKKLIKGRDEVTKTVIPKYQKNVSDWESKNNVLFNNKVNDVVTQSNQIYQNGINAVASENPEFASGMNSYKQRIMNASSEEEKKMVLTEFDTFLKSNPKASDLVKQRESAINSATDLAKSEYMEAKSQFLKKNYTEATKEFKDKWRLATYKVYKSGLNGDVNMYVSVDRLTHSGAFAKMSYAEKRDAIQSEWSKDKSALGRYLKDTQEWFPQEGEEYKPFTEWTGRREKSDELKKEHSKQYNDRTGRGAEERYYMYGVDELLNPPDKQLNTYMIKSVAKDETKKLDVFLSEFKEATGLTPRLSTGGIGGSDLVAYDYDDKTKEKIFGANSPYAKTANPIQEYIIKEFPAFDLNKNTANPSEALVNTLRAKESWGQVYNHDENDKDWWGDFSSGFGSQTQVPLIGSLLSTSKTMSVNNAITNYQKGSMTMAEISLVDSVASLNSLKQLNPPSISKQVGEMLGATTSIAMDMLLTGGVFRATSSATKSVVDDLFTAGIKNAYKADNAIGAYALDVLSNPKNLERVQNVVGTITGSLAQNVSLTGNTIEMTLERMKPEMTLSYGGGLDPLITQINNNGEGWLEAYLKSFGVNWANIAVERFAPVLGNGTLKKEAMQQIGSTPFLEQMAIGRWFRSQGFKSVDDASKALQNGLGWSNIVDEAFVEELLLSKNIEALITGDDSLFHYSSDDVITTTLGVGLFGLPMGVAKASHIRIFNNSDNTNIETTNQDGSRISTPVGKDTWNQFNRLLSAKDMDLQKIVTFFDQQKLPDEQQNALLNVYAKTKGNNLRNDPHYVKAKSDYESNIGQTVDDSYLDETKVSVMNERKPSEPEIKSVDELLNEAQQQEKELGELAIDSDDNPQVQEQKSDSLEIPVDKNTIQADSGQNDLNPKELVSDVPLDNDVTDDILPNLNYDINSDIPDIDYEEQVLSPGKESQASTESEITSEPEVVVLPPTNDSGEFRRMEKVDGVWKMAQNDSFVDVDESVQKEAQNTFESEVVDDSSIPEENKQRANLERTVTKFAEAIKMKTDVAYSTILPIPPKLWNAFVDLTKEGILKGYDISKAIQHASKSIFNEYIKSGDIKNSDAIKAKQMVKNLYNDYQKKTSRPTKSTQRQIDKTVGVKTDQPYIRLKEKQILKEKINSYNKGSKSAIKELQDIKKNVVAYANSILDLKDLNATETKALLAKVRDAKDVDTVNDAFSRIDAIAQKQDDRKKVDLVNKINSKLGNKKTFLKRAGKNWKLKISKGAIDDLNNFIDNEIPSDLNSLSSDELNVISDVIDGILVEGKADVKNADIIRQSQNQRNKAMLVKNMAFGKKPIQLKSEEEILDHLNKGQIAILNDQLITSKTGYEEFKKLNPEIESGIGYPKYTTNDTKLLNESKSFFSRRMIMGKLLFMENLFKNIWGDNKEVKDFMQTKISDPLKEAENNYVNDTRVLKKQLDNKRSEIFGSNMKAKNRLLDISTIDPRYNSFESQQTITNDMMVHMYCISQIENGKEQISKSGVDLDVLDKYISDNKDLKEWGDFLLDDFLPEMKETISPLYEKQFGIELPEGKYYPKFSDADYISSTYNLEDLVSGNASFNMASPLAASLNQRVKYTGAVDVTSGTSATMDNYIDSMMRSKYYMPIAEQMNILMDKNIKPLIINKLGNKNYLSFVNQITTALTGSHPSKVNAANTEAIINDIASFTAITAVGGKLKSMITQPTSIINYATAGIKDGVYPHDFLAASITGKEGFELFKEWVTSPYIADRYFGGSYDLALKQLTKSTSRHNSKSKRNFSKGREKVTLAFMSPTLIGDAASSCFGGAKFYIAQYRNALKKGMSEQESKAFAYQRAQIVTNETQQSSTSYTTTESQRSNLSRILLPFRTGQVAYMNKIYGALKTMSNPEAYSSMEKLQAVADIFTTLSATALFAAVTNGMLNAIADDDDEDVKKHIAYETAKDSATSLLQGFGMGGMFIETFVNSFSGKDYFNSSPTINQLYGISKTTKDLVTLAADEQKDWKDLTDYQKKEVYRSIGANNIIKQYDELSKVAKGDKTLFDAIMGYDPENHTPEEEDLIYNYFFGTPVEPKSETISQDKSDDMNEMDDTDTFDSFDEVTEE